MDEKTKTTIDTYNRCAKNFEAKFMDLAPYRESLAEYGKCVKAGDSVLDLGCGPGNVAKHLLLFSPSIHILGVDLSEEMIRLARANVPGARFEVNDIRDIDYPEKAFDHIMAAFCLPFLYDEEAVALIEKISRYVKTGGHVYVSTMMGSGYGYEIPGFSDGGEMFFNYYPKEFLEREFSKNGLEVMHEKIQDYANADGTILKDMIFILRKR